MNIAGRYRGPVVTYGLYAKADVCATDIALNATNSSFRIHARGSMFNRFTGGIDINITCHLQVPGLHNIYNALAAAAGCLVNQILPESIQNGLARFKGVERRMQIREMRDFTVLDDTALNPGSIDTVFEAIRQLSYRQIIIITAIRGNRGTEINRENALRLAKWAQTYQVQRVIVTSSHSHLDRLNRVSPDEEAIFLKTLTEANISFAHFKELPDAIRLGLQYIGSGDLLVLIGAHGMDDGVNILESILPPTDSIYFQSQTTDTAVI
jgi:UDP-N-acetylmuramoyl-L-alanyl-D-glutamate--2,6-diaminopimelate ligase